MNKERFLSEIRGKQIADIILSEGSAVDDFKIKTIITTDGFHIDIDKSAISHPAYDKELAEFLDKLSKATPNSFFEMRVQELSLDEMRNYAGEHGKAINANSNGVTQIYNGNYKVSFGEDLKDLRAR